MRDMEIFVLPKKSERELELSFKSFGNKSKHNKSPDSEVSISIDIPNAMSLIAQLEKGIKTIMGDVHERLAKIKSTPSLAQEDPSHNKEA